MIFGCIDLNQRHVINNYWEVEEKIGSGGFGVVYSVRGMRGERAAAKIALSDRDMSLLVEARMYERLRAFGQTDGFPQMYFFGEYLGKPVMILERLGTSIRQYISQFGRITLARAAPAVVQLLERVKSIHNVGMLHLDLNDANVMSGMGQNENTLYVMDFGLSQSFMNGAYHIGQANYVEPRGHQYFSSVRCQEGWSQSRRDDLEQVAYVFVRMVRGALPWEYLNVNDVSLITRLKREWRESKMWDGFPAFMKHWMKYILELGFEEEPNYAWLQGVVRMCASAPYFQLGGSSSQ